MFVICGKHPPLYYMYLTFVHLPYFRCVPNIVLEPHNLDSVSPTALATEAVLRSTHNLDSVSPTALATEAVLRSTHNLDSVSPTALATEAVLRSTHNLDSVSPTALATEAVLRSTHNLRFRAEIRHIMFSCLPQFCYMCDLNFMGV